MLEVHNFEQEWNAIAHLVLAYCQQHVDRQDDVDEIFQRILIRAWRGYPTFRHESSYLTWVLRIAQREIARMIRHEYVTSQREVSLEGIQENASAILSFDSPYELSDTGYQWLVKVTRIAADNKYLTSDDALVILARLKQPAASWDTLGTLLHISGSTCAVIHCRAIPKLRVFLFVERPDLLGGLEAIGQAFERCRDLNAEEAEAFQRIVLLRQTNYRRAGWRVALRSACGKIIRWLPPLSS